MFLILLGLFVVSEHFGMRIGRQTLWLLVPLGFFSFMVFVRSSELLTFLNVLASLLILLLIAKTAFSEQLKTFFVSDYIKVLFLPFSFIAPLLRTVSDVLSLRGLQKDPKVTSQIVKGIMMTLPVLIIFLWLFSSADLIFQDRISRLVSFDIPPDFVFQTVLVLFVGAMFAGAYSYMMHVSPTEASARRRAPGALGDIESSILLGSVNVLFFFFIVIQLTYLFGGESNISSYAFTYAEYARKGFFELIAVAILSFLLIRSMEKRVAKEEAGHRMLFKVLGSVLIAQVIIVMGSAFKRLSLYEEAYGFTTLRLYSHAFILLLAIVFCLLLYKIYKNQQENLFAFHIFLSVVLFLFVMNVLNPDAFIAQKNMDRFSRSGELDIYYIDQLSYDALPVSIGILNIKNEDMRNAFAGRLYWQLQSMESPYMSGWQSLNISRLDAKKLLQPKAKRLESFKNNYYQETDFSPSMD